MQIQQICEMVSLVSVHVCFFDMGSTYIWIFGGSTAVFPLKVNVHPSAR
jgi:hypothetical protein